MDSIKVPSVRISNVSYLYARDPSILTFNLNNLETVRTNLKPQLENQSLSEYENGTSESSEMEETQKTEQEHLAIYLRIKNGYEFEDIYKVEENTLVCSVPPDSNCMRNVRQGDSLKKMFSFSKIFKGTSQVEMFNSIVKHKILEFINGRNSSLLTYGASGSGKTFTISGDANDPGLIPRTLEYLFRTLPPIAENPLVRPLPNDDVAQLNESSFRGEIHLLKNILNSSGLDKKLHHKTYNAMAGRLSTENVGLIENFEDITVSVWVSFAEIYNEHIYDLLEPPPANGKKRKILQLGSGSNGNTYIKNLTSVYVKSGAEAYQIYQYGLNYLNYASTRLNSHSSRSHSIFTIKLIQVSRTDNGVYLSKFNFCDLAGSERLKKTGNVGERLRESNNINTSLLVLSRCIENVRNAQKNAENKRIPFRESKLTQLFQNALSGLEDMSMIVTINPAKQHFDDSHHVLNFAAIAKEIEHKIQPIKPKKKNRFSELVELEAVPEHSINNGDGESEQSEEIQKLYDVIDLLKEALNEQKMESELKLEQTKEFIMDNYKKLIKDLKKRFEDERKELVKNHNDELLKLKTNYECLRNGDESIINLDSDEEDRNLEIISELRNEIKDLKKSILETNSELELQKLLLKNTKEESAKILEETVGDAVKEYNVLRTEYQQLQKELFLLKEKNCEYELEIKAYRNTCMQTNFTSSSESVNKDEPQSAADQEEF